MLDTSTQRKCPYLLNNKQALTVHLAENLISGRRQVSPIPGKSTVYLSRLQTVEGVSMIGRFERQ